MHPQILHSLPNNIRILQLALDLHTGQAKQSKWKKWTGQPELLLHKVALMFESAFHTEQASLLIFFSLGPNLAIHPSNDSTDI